jgi:hypothetical protein
MVLHIDEDSWNSVYFFFWANFLPLGGKKKNPGATHAKNFCEKKGAKIAIF